MVMRGTTNCAILRVIAELNGVFILTIVVFISYKIAGYHFNVFSLESTLYDAFTAN